MIEIKEGWSVDDTSRQYYISDLNYQIAGLNKKLEAALETRAKLQERCQHNHVIFAGQEMTCEVCGSRIDK